MLPGSVRVVFFSKYRLKEFYEMMRNIHSETKAKKKEEKSSLLNCMFHDQPIGLFQRDEKNRSAFMELSGEGNTLVRVLMAKE